MRASSSEEVLDLKGSVVLDLLKAPKARPERRVVNPEHSLTLRCERDINDIVARLTSPVEPVKTTKKAHMLINLFQQASSLKKMLHI